MAHSLANKAVPSSCTSNHVLRNLHKHPHILHFCSLTSLPLLLPLHWRLHLVVRLSVLYCGAVLWCCTVMLHCGAALWCCTVVLHCSAAYNHHLRFNTPEGLTAWSLWSLAPSLRSSVLWQWMAHNLDSECFGLYKTCAHPHSSAVLLDMVMREGETGCQVTDQLRENNCTQVHV